MRKITQVRLKNFQSHVDTVVNFDDYNIIYGKTNSGKSAILRGLKWALYNLPPAEGVDFRRFGTKETVVEVSFDDGKKITRRRTAKENEYVLDDNGNKKSFTQFGRGPLKEVLDFHGMYQVNLFGQPQSINIVEQSEPPFFLSNGPTARGKLIGRLAGTVLYERALSLIRKDVSNINKTISQNKDNLESVNKEIEDLSYVDDLESFLKTASDTEKQISELNTNIKNISDKSSTISHAFDVREKNKKMAEYKESALQAENIFNAISSCSAAMNQIAAYQSAMTGHYETWKKNKQLSYSVEQVNELMSEIDNLTSLTAALNNLGNVSTTICDKFESVAKNSAKAAAKEKYDNTISSLLQEVQDNNAWMSDVNNRLSLIQTSYLKVVEQEHKKSVSEKLMDEAQNKYKEALLSEGFCPTCGQSITKAVTDNLSI